MATPSMFPQGLGAPVFFAKGLVFASLPSVAVAGWIATVTDSPTTALGAVLTVGGGINTVLAYYNGTEWVVAAGATGPDDTELPYTQYTAISGSTVTAPQLAGAQQTFLLSSGATGLTLPAASAIIGAAPGWQVGDTYLLRVLNTDGSTLTLTAGANTTINGGSTSALTTNTWKDYIVTFATGTTITLQTVGSGVAP